MNVIEKVDMSGLRAVMWSKSQLEDIKTAIYY